MTSPLDEALPQSLAELFSRDPLKLTRDDRATIVTVLRAARNNFAIQDSQPKAPRKKAAAPRLAPDPSLTLDDLGL